jgi:hypothetical protein
VGSLDASVRPRIVQRPLCVESRARSHKPATPATDAAVQLGCHGFRGVSVIQDHKGARLDRGPQRIPGSIPAVCLVKNRFQSFQHLGNIRTRLSGGQLFQSASLCAWPTHAGQRHKGGREYHPLRGGGYRTSARLNTAAPPVRAVYRQTLAQYQKTVLTAYQEVEDQLAALRILAGEAQSTADAVTAAQQAETIALNRYRNGLVSYLDVVHAQTALLANQRTATQIVGQRMVATVVLVKALGGGWLGVPGPAGTTAPGAPNLAGEGGQMSGKLLILAAISCFTQSAFIWVPGTHRKGLGDTSTRPNKQHIGRSPARQKSEIKIITQDCPHPHGSCSDDGTALRVCCACYP